MNNYENYENKIKPLFKFCSMEDYENLHPIKGIDDVHKSKFIYALLMGILQPMKEIDESEYCEELKEILNRGYFEIEFTGITRRVNIPKDWKPQIYEREEIPTIHRSKWDSFKEWIVENIGFILGISGFLCGICGLFLGLFL